MISKKCPQPAGFEPARVNPLICKINSLTTRTRLHIKANQWSVIIVIKNVTVIRCYLKQHHNKFIYIFWSNYLIFRSSRGTIHDSLISLLSIVIVKYRKGPLVWTQIHFWRDSTCKMISYYHQQFFHSSLQILWQSMFFA